MSALPIRPSSQSRTRWIGAAAAAAVVGSTLIAAQPAAAATNITINLSQSTGAVKHGANGFLYGLGSDGVPTDTMLDGLTRLGVAAQKAPDGLQHPTGDALKVAPQWKRNGGGDVQIYMQDIYFQWPYEEPGLNDYLPKVDQIVRKVLADPNRSSYVYVPFNEPDWIWYDNDLNTLKNDWKTVYQRIRALDPAARIAGPNYSYYDGAEYRDFMTFAKANNVLPDIMTWHELGNDFFSGWYDHVDNYRQIERDLGISTRPISINEYARPAGDLAIPGNLVQWITRLETSKVDGSLAYWNPAGTLSDLVTQNNRATGAWWLYHWYGAMTGNTVQVTLPDRNQSTQALATYDASRSQARILLGGNTDPGQNFDANLSLTGLSGTAFSSSAHVTVYGVDSTGTQPSGGPVIVRETDVTASGGTLSLPLNGLKGSSAYYAVVTPNSDRAPAQANRYEAEYARISGSARINYGPDAGYAGTGYVDGFLNSSSAASTFFVTAPENGFYTLSVRYSAGPQSGGPADRSLKLTVNRRDAQNVALPGTANWNTTATKTVRVYLPAGINQIGLGAYTSDNADNVTLDYLQVDAATGSATTYEAEASGNTRSGQAAVSSNAAASGGRQVGYIGNGTANSLRINNVTAPAAGDYTLVIRYTQAESTDRPFNIVDRFADISVNGGTASRVAFANTYSWDTYWTASVRVTLAAGQNNILIGNSTGWAPNVDYVLVAPTVS